MQNSGVASSSEFRVFETAEFCKALTRLDSASFLRKKLASYVYPQVRQNPYFGTNIRKLQG
ncbi:MAG: hypothetical protein NTV22_11695 [bacterium]|nr:hypothetical protein [bacterium]